MENILRILIVEDEKKLANNIKDVLVSILGAAVDISNDGIDGQHMCETAEYDAIILDLMLPGCDGITILRNIRSKGVESPVLILTALDGVENIVAGLEAGSDDYLTKPFEIPELLARVKALTRRKYHKPDPTIKIGKLTINTSNKNVEVDGKTIEFRPMEYGLLEYMAMRKGEIVSKEAILESLYDFNSEIFSNVVEVYISNLRKLLKENDMPCKISTYRGRGYRLEEDE